MRQIELLAPAGDRLSIDAALKHGADAVYLGAVAFGARASAGFDEASLREAIGFAHLYGKRVYVTVNTLIKDNELSEVSALVRKLDELQADALIIQDIGLLRMLRGALPHMALHASTQMSIHNAAGARWLLSKGVSRVVLARECGMNDIRAVAETGIETEVFVHGAQCVSVSGQCLLSSQIGGRSGNRGRCAQPCRLSYRYRGRQGAWLSPRDLCLLPLVPQLIRAGASSFKIEGRLKRPEYVAVVTDAYRRAIDCALEGKPNDTLEKDRRALLQIFNRGGFTGGYASGERDGQIMYPGHVSHEGLPLGSIQNSWPRGEGYQASLILDSPLCHGDMLQIRSDPHQELIYSGPGIGAGETALIRHHKKAAAGDAVYRLLDESQLKAARESTAAPMPPIPLSAHLRLILGERSRLTLSDGKSAVTCYGDAPTPAQSRPLTEALCRSSIGKTGDSPFRVDDFQLEAHDPVFLTRASLNALRRSALEEMAAQRLKDYQRPSAVAAEAETQKEPAPMPEGLYAQTEDPASFDALRDAGADHILYSPRDFTLPGLEADLGRLGGQDFLCLPRQLRDGTLNALCETINRLGLNVVLGNVAQLVLRWPAMILAGSGIPVWNRQSLAMLKSHGLSGFVLSDELRRDEALALEDQALPMVLTAYGRCEVMLLNHCPERSFRGLSGPQRLCHLCDAGEGTRGRQLVDRLGAAFPLSPQRLPEGCLNRLLFHRPINLMEKAFGRRWLLFFHDEPADEAVRILRYYRALMRGGDPQPLHIPYYSGRLFEGVQ